jgi:hypothetical protein
MFTIIYSIGFVMLLLGGLILILGQLVAFRYLPDQRRRKLGPRIALIVCGWVAILVAFFILFISVLHR